jgi:hypothetical protein
VLGSAQLSEAFVIAETGASAQTITEAVAEKPRRDVYVTVFVHGIISVKPHLSIENMIRFMRDEIENTHYEKTVTLMREDPFFHQNQPMQSQGLNPIAMEPLKRGAGATLLAHVINKIEKISQPNEPTENLYYTFGWSGIMSHSVRYREAKKFYQGLIDLRNSLHAQGIEPHFRIIGYSHGGQVIMVLARVRQQEDIDPTLRIDETLLYGMPVHSFTAECVNDPLFVKIYNIYSPGDRIQKLDIFTIGEFCSKQIFSQRHIGFKRPKLVQVEMRVIRKAGVHPDAVDEPRSGQFHYTGPRKSYLLRDVSPGHTEMWFFGWTPLHYRPSFPLYPLPIVALTPYIINTLRPLEQEMDPAVPITMMLYPHHNVALLKQYNEKCWDIVPFISADKMYAIRKEIEQYAPIEFTNNLYNYHIQIAYDEAHLFHQQRKKDVRRLRYKSKCTTVQKCS